MVSKYDLLEALDKNDVDKAKQLLSSDRAPELLHIVDNRKDGYNYTALHYAAWRRLTECCQLILQSDQGAHFITMRSTSGRTPLHLAADYGYLEIVNLLINTKQGLECITMQNKQGHTPLHFAASWGYSKVVKTFLQTKQGYDALTIKNEDGQTPLDLATKEKETETIAILKEAMNSRKL
jgi:ankyrin repeat protein